MYVYLFMEDKVEQVQRKKIVDSGGGVEWALLLQFDCYIDDVMHVMLS